MPRHILPLHQSPDAEKRGPQRKQRLGFISNRVRNHAIATLAEFAGTFMFLFFAFAATQVANAASPVTQNHGLSQTPNTSVLLYISLSFGFSLVVNVWAFFRISGGLFNPVVCSSPAASLPLTPETDPSPHRYPSASHSSAPSAPSAQPSASSPKSSPPSPRRGS